MWEQIGAGALHGAIYGAIGGGVGGLLGATIASLFKNSRFAQMAATIFVVAGVVLGARLAEPLLKPYIGEYLPKSSATNEADEVFDAAIAEMIEFPTFAAILEREPGIKDELKKGFDEALDSSASAAAAQLQAFSSAYAIIQARFYYYVARATEEDLEKYLVLNVEVTRSLLERDPQFCYDVNYNPGVLSSLSGMDEIREKFGPVLFDRQQNEGATLVRNAYDEVPVIDEGIALQGLNSASAVLVEILGEENLGFVTGAKSAKNIEEATLVCRATLEMLENIVEQENSLVVARYIFSNSAN
ncbi:MAG: hypothetical protein DHS20C05_22330 [Hyphococcus sp.]|nr:MAG: hypothetical protein DHS20C05_22330 [Marinicaulis sp.]